MKTFTMCPIGVVRSPFTEKASAPRQPQVAEAKGTVGTIELHPGHGFEHALEDLAGWGRIWVVFVFDRNDGWRPKVLPPRSIGRRRGVFATRSPHRPNPIGLSAVELISVAGLVLTVRDLDILDGSPVLDLKPYVPYADAFPDARAGWLEGARDPAPTYDVRWSPRAEAEARWLAARGVDLTAKVNGALALGPQPNAYRRIRKTDAGALRLAVKDWRVDFDVEGLVLTVRAIASGYRDSQLYAPDTAREASEASEASKVRKVTATATATGPRERQATASPEVLALHRAFVEAFRSAPDAGA